MDEIVKSFKAEKKLSKCESCGGSFVVYHGLGEYKCESCGITFFDDYGKVRKYIEENGPSMATDISDGTGVSRRKVNTLLQDGKVGLYERYPRKKGLESLKSMQGKMRFVRNNSK
jgi:ribosomal protein S27AE